MTPHPLFDQPAYWSETDQRPDDAIFAPLKLSIDDAATVDDLTYTPAMQIALIAMKRRYYWEAHELLEALWLSAPPSSAEQILLKSLIQYANAGLKARLDKASAAQKIFHLAHQAKTASYRLKPRIIMHLTEEFIQEIEDQIQKELHYNAQ